MNDQLQIWSSIAGLLGLFIAILSLLRDTFNFQLQWSDSSSLLKRTIVDRRVWFLTAGILWGFSLWFPYSKVKVLESEIASRDTIIKLVYATQTAQATEIADLTNKQLEQGHELLFDNFNTKRGNNQGIELIETSALTTTISGGHYVATFNTDNKIKYVNIIPGKKVANFDIDINFAEAIAKEKSIFFEIRFREIPNKIVSAFGIFLAGENKGDYFIYHDFMTPDLPTPESDESKKERRKTTTGKAVFNQVDSLKISCNGSECEFFINERAYDKKTALVEVTGDFRIGFSGSGTVRLDDITINIPN